MKRTNYILRTADGKLLLLSTTCAVMQRNLRQKDSDVYGANGTHWAPFSYDLTDKSWVGDVITVHRQIPNQVLSLEFKATIVAKQCIEYAGTTFPVSKLEHTIKSSKDFAALYEQLAEQQKQAEWARQRAAITASSQRYGRSYSRR